MSLLVALITLLLVAIAVFVISAPIRASSRSLDAGGDQEGAGAPGAGAEQSRGEPAAFTREQLDAARQAKYQEIRDAELDFRTGKLSREDYEATDAALRAEALEILDRLEGEDR